MAGYFPDCAAATLRKSSEIHIPDTTKLWRELEAFQSTNRAHPIHSRPDWPTNRTGRAILLCAPSANTCASSFFFPGSSGWTFSHAVIRRGRGVAYASHLHTLLLGRNGRHPRCLIHHDPGQGEPGEQAVFARRYQQTLASYRKYFGEPPADIWGPGNRNNVLRQRAQGAQRLRNAHDRVSNIRAHRRRACVRHLAVDVRGRLAEEKRTPT